MMAFQNPCKGSTVALMNCRGTLTWVRWMCEYTRFALDGIHVMRMTAKKSSAHFVYCHAARLMSLWTCRANRGTFARGAELFVCALACRDPVDVVACALGTDGLMSLLAAACMDAR